MSWILKKGSSNLLKLLRKHRMRLIWTFRMTASMQSKKARQKAVWQHTKSPISKRVNSGSSTIAWKRGSGCHLMLTSDQNHLVDTVYGSGEVRLYEVDDRGVVTDRLDVFQ